MFFPDSAFDIFAEWNIIDLYDVYKGLIFSNFTNLAIDDVTHLNIEALDWKFVFNKVSVILAAQHTDDWCEDKVLVEIETVRKLLLVVFGQLLAHLHSLVQVIVHQ